MTITHISRRTLMLGIAVIFALSLLLALAFAAPRGIPSFSVSHTSTHLVSHGRLADGGFPAPPLCPPDACPRNN